jgi:hypothetical protein
MYKGLVTSGCSFSLYDISHNEHGWPCYLQQQLLSDGILSEDFDSFHRGLGGNGNMLIARNTYDALNQLLKKGIKGEDILCIVQWSSISRHQIFLEKDDDYYLMYSHEDGLGRIYHRYFQNHINDVINGLWNWTTLQNYCEVNNIKPYYTFMFEHDKEMLLDDELGGKHAWEYLRDDIKRDNVLISITKYLEEHRMKNLFVPDGHPSTRGHKIFSDYLIKGLTCI